MTSYKYIHSLESDFNNIFNLQCRLKLGYLSLLVIYFILFRSDRVYMYLPGAEQDSSQKSGFFKWKNIHFHSKLLSTFVVDLNRHTWSMRGLLLITVSFLVCSNQEINPTCWEYWTLQNNFWKLTSGTKFTFCVVYRGLKSVRWLPNRGVGWKRKATSHRKVSALFLASFQINSSRDIQEQTAGKSVLPWPEKGVNELPDPYCI